MRLEPVTAANYEAALELRVRVPGDPRPGPRPGRDRAYVSWEPRDGGPGPFYLKLGFRPTGEQSGGQTVAVRDL